MNAPVQRRVRAAMWLFDRSRTARLAFVVVTFPVVFVLDRWSRYGRVMNPATFTEGLGSAWRGGWTLTDDPDDNPRADAR